MRRRSLLLLPLPLLVVLVGCPSAPPRDLGPPPQDCATRPPASVALIPRAVDGGPGPADEPLLITQGIQGGDHIYLDVQCHHLGPIVLIEPTVRDAKTGEVLSEAGLFEVDDLRDPVTAVEPDGGWRPFQVQGRLAGNPSTVIGRTVVLSARVTDACPHSAGASETGLVTGYDMGF